MAYLCVDVDGTENKFIFKPQRLWCENKITKEKSGGLWWGTRIFGTHIDTSNKGEKLPKGTIAKLIGRELTWSDEPVELE